MDYETMRTFAATWGLIGLMALFIGAVAYALWPRNRGKFDRASRLPLEDE